MGLLVLRYLTSLLALIVLVLVLDSAFWFLLQAYQGRWCPNSPKCGRTSSTRFAANRRHILYSKHKCIYTKFCVHIENVSSLRRE